MSFGVGPQRPPGFSGLNLTSTSLLDVAGFSSLIQRMTDTTQLFRLLHRLWIFEEDMWMSSLHQPPLPLDHQLALVSDQLCVILPVVRKIMTTLPDIQSLQNFYQALTLQLGLPWQHLQWAPTDESAEGRARCLLFLLKTMHLHSLLRSFPQLEPLLALQGHMPQQTTFVKQVRTMGRLQQIFLQTATQAEVLLMWRQGIMARASLLEKEIFLRQCLLDVPSDEQELFPFLCGVLQLSESHLLSLQVVMAHVQDFQLQLLTLLFRKPAAVTVDAYCFAKGVPSPSMAHPNQNINLHPNVNANANHTASTSALSMSSMPNVQQNSIASPTTSFSSHPFNQQSASLNHSSMTSASAASHPGPSRVLSPSGPRIDAMIHITKQPPKETIKDKILNPVPAIRIEGLRDSDVDYYVVRASLVRYGETQEVDDGIQGSSLQQIPSSRILNFKKIKLKHTCKQLDCNRVTLRFQLLRKHENGSLEQTGVESLSDPIEVYSHTSQLNSSVRDEGSPSISGIIPDNGPLEGGIPAVVLGVDLNPGPNSVIVFGNVVLRPIHAEVGWVIINIPPYHPQLGNPVNVTLSTDGGNTVCETLCKFTYAS